MKEEVVFCDNCGLAVKPEYISGFKLLIVSVNNEEHYFCNEKCKKKWEQKHSFSWKGGKCKNGAGYVYIYNPKHPFCTKQGYVREHRLIMEKHIGRYLHKWEIVHHINEIRDDNRVENLKLMGKSEHDRFEAFKKQFWKKKAKSC